MCIHYCQDFACECRQFACETELCERWQAGSVFCNLDERKNCYTKCPRCWAGKLATSTEEARKALDTFEDTQNALLAAVDDGDMSSFHEALRAAKKELAAGAEVRRDHLQKMSALTLDMDRLVESINHGGEEDWEQSRCSRPSFWADDSDQDSFDGSTFDDSEFEGESAVGSDEAGSSSCPSSAFSVFSASDDSDDSDSTSSSGGGVPVLYVDDEHYAASSEYSSDDSDDSDTGSDVVRQVRVAYIDDDYHYYSDYYFDDDDDI